MLSHVLNVLCVMKIKQTPFSIITLVIVVAFCGLMAIMYLKETKKYKQIPLLELAPLQGEVIKTAKILEEHHPCAFVFFHPACPHCIDEMHDIVEACRTNEKYKWFFITTASSTEAERFFSNFSQQLPNKIYIIAEEDYPQAHLLFDVSSPPAVFRLNAKHPWINFTRSA